MKNAAEKFCRNLIHEYMENRNYDLVVNVIDPRISVFGTGSHEVSRNVEELEKAIDKEVKSFQGSFKIIDEWYQATALNHNQYLVIAQIVVKEESDKPLVYEFLSRVTFVIEYQQDGWKVIHVHHSVPDEKQGSDEYFPHGLIEASRLALEKTIEKKTQELEMLNQQVLHDLKHDYLTQLLNRHYFEKTVVKTMLETAQGAIIIIDVDSFKTVNDSYGHPFGDEVLIALAKTLKNSFQDDICGRIGGDEFLVYVKGVEDIMQRADDFKAAWQSYQSGLNWPMVVNISMGIAMYPRHGKDYHELWSNGDKALYWSKNNGRNQISMFTR